MTSGIRRRTSALVAAFCVLITLAGPLGPMRAEGAEPEPVVPTTPLLSARRLPDVLQGAVADPALAAELDPYLDAAAGSVCASVLDRGRVAYSRNLGESMAPASVVKLLTATAALEVFGPDHVLTTRAGAASPIADGVVDGDLYVVGGGDPLLVTGGYIASLDDPEQRTEDFAALADALVASGLRQVRGDVVGDDARHENVRWVPSWPDRYQREGFVGPLSALMVNDGQTGFTTSPGEPSTDRKPGDPPALAAQTLLTLLEDRGVRVDGHGSSGTAPADLTEIAHLDSVPMSEVVAEMLTDSDNTTVELLTRELGLARAGEGTTAAGTEVISQTLAAMGLPTEGLALKDGSGLDPDNAVPCALPLAILERSGPDSIIGRGLAVAGQTGTLRKRMTDSGAAGVLHAKTGTLNEVNALAGFATTPTGNDITFVMVQNGLQANGFGFVDGFAEQLLTYAQGPSLDALGPTPPSS